MRPDSLTNTKTKNVFQQQNCTNKQQPPTPRETPEHEHTVIAWMLATTIHTSNTTPHHQDEATTNPPPHTRGPRACCLRTQQCAWRSRRRGTSPADTFVVAHPPAPTTGAGALSLTAMNPHIEQGTGEKTVSVLLRKEVIQPHLPVRLPCYDFVPIADPTFDSSPPKRVRPLASGVTDFHDVTGGVYKARERIHRSVADLRLLATPTSRGRVADPDPN